MYSWSDMNVAPEVYIGKDAYKYIKCSIFSVVTSKGDLFYMFFDAS